MPAAKNYPLYRAMISSFLNLAASRGWPIVSEKEIQHGYQIVVTDGITRNNVDIFPSGKILAQGQEGDLRSEILLWRDKWKNPTREMLEAVATQPLLVETPVIPLEKARPVAREKTIEEHMANFTRVAVSAAGKDDYFGPLVVSAISIDAWIEAQLVMLGVHNTLADEQTIVVAQKIQGIAPHALITISNKSYNEAFGKVGNADKLLAWSYARVIEQIAGRASCNTVVASSFGDETIIQTALAKKNHQVTLRQSAAQNDIGIAAASLLARAECIQRVAQLAKQVGVTLPGGFSDPSIIAVEREIVAKSGQTALSAVAKLHFRTTENTLKS
jgi:ribonuclease HIII